MPSFRRFFGNLCARFTAKAILLFNAGHITPNSALNTTTPVVRIEDTQAEFLFIGQEEVEPVLIKSPELEQLGAAAEIASLQELIISKPVADHQSNKTNVNFNAYQDSEKLIPIAPILAAAHPTVTSAKRTFEDYSDDEESSPHPRKHFRCHGCLLAQMLSAASSGGASTSGDESVDSQNKEKELPVASSEVKIPAGSQFLPVLNINTAPAQAEQAVVAAPSIAMSGQESKSKSSETDEIPNVDTSEVIEVSEEGSSVCSADNQRKFTQMKAWDYLCQQYFLHKETADNNGESLEDLGDLVATVSVVMMGIPNPPKNMIAWKQDMTLKDDEHFDTLDQIQTNFMDFITSQDWTGSLSLSKESLLKSKTEAFMGEIAEVTKKHCLFTKDCYTALDALGHVEDDATSDIGTFFSNEKLGHKAIEKYTRLVEPAAEQDELVDESLAKYRNEPAVPGRHDQEKKLVRNKSEDLVEMARDLLWRYQQLEKNKHIFQERSSSAIKDMEEVLRHAKKERDSRYSELLKIETSSDGTLHKIEDLKARVECLEKENRGLKQKCDSYHDLVMNQSQTLEVIGDKFAKIKKQVGRFVGLQRSEKQADDEGKQPEDEAEAQISISKPQKRSRLDFESDESSEAKMDFPAKRTKYEQIASSEEYIGLDTDYHDSTVEFDGNVAGGQTNEEDQSQQEDEMAIDDGVEDFPIVHEESEVMDPSTLN